MSSIISDGTGQDYKAKVNSLNQLHTESITEAIEVFHSIKGHSYNMNFGNVTLTSANSSALLYLKNNEEVDIVIFGAFYLMGASTGGSGDQLVEIIKNPTAGTIIDNAVDNIPMNRNFGSSNALTVDAYTGVEGDTFTTHEGAVIQSLINGTARVAINVGGIILPKGTSIGIRLTPATGNTSQSVQVALGMYLDKFGVN